MEHIERIYLRLGRDFKTPLKPSANLKNSAGCVCLYDFANLRFTAESPTRVEIGVTVPTRKEKSG